MDRTDPRYLEAVRQVRADPCSRFCFVSGQAVPAGGGDPHHVLPVSIYPEYAYTKENIVIVNRIPHHTLDQGTAEQIAKLPKIHNLLARMRSLDQRYYEQFKSKLLPWMHFANGWD